MRKERNIGYKMESMISIIIPVYNVKKYFIKCMDSVLSQTYPNYEVILVDDGSTDGSEDMCDDYARKSDRVRVLHQRNQGVAAARNNGVNISKGEYIAFVDSDDIVAAEYLSRMYDIMKKYDADMAVAGIEFVDEGDRIPNRRGGGMDECLTNEEALIKCCYGDGICAGLCAKLYQRKILEKYLNSSFQVWEDFYTVYHVIRDSEKIAAESKVVYYYIQREGSALHGMMNEKKMTDAMTVLNELLEYVDMYFPKAKPAAQIRCARAMLQCMAMILRTSGDTRTYYERVRKFLGMQIYAVKQDDFVSAGFKIRCSLIVTGYNTCRFLLPVMDRVGWIRNNMKKILTKRFSDV